MIDGHCVRNLARSMVRLLLIEVPLVLLISASSLAQTYTVLHTFTGDDGVSPFAKDQNPRPFAQTGTIRTGHLVS